MNDWDERKTNYIKTMCSVIVVCKKKVVAISPLSTAEDVYWDESDSNSELLWMDDDDELEFILAVCAQLTKIKLKQILCVCVCVCRWIIIIHISERQWMRSPLVNVAHFIVNLSKSSEANHRRSAYFLHTVFTLWHRKSPFSWCTLWWGDSVNK